MTDGDMLAIAVVGLAVGCWLWEHPTVAKGLGLVVLVGIVGIGVAHAAQGQSQRHHRRGCGRGHHRRNSSGGRHRRRDMRE
jgi:hypothetical protein